MVTERDKYRAQFFQIAAFALMTPFAKMFLELRFMHLKDYSLSFFLFGIAYIVLFILGFILATIGITYLEEKGE